MSPLINMNIQEMNEYWINEHVLIFKKKTQKNKRQMLRMVRGVEEDDLRVGRVEVVNGHEG